VTLVAHLQHLHGNGLDVDRTGVRPLAHGFLQQWPEHGRHPAQAFDHLRAVGAVTQHLA
jgi:hypothetical protein